MKKLVSEAKLRSVHVRLLCTALCLLLSGCKTPPIFLTKMEKASGFTYIPIDPFAVEIPSRAFDPATNGSGSRHRWLLESFPDNAVRMSVEHFDTKGRVSYGTASATAKGEIYRVTLDYINADTANFAVTIRKTMIERISKARTAVPPFEVFNPYDNRYVYGSELYTVERRSDLVIGDRAQGGDPLVASYNIPIYIGIGLRVTADIRALSGKINITGLGAIGAEAEASRLNGSLVVQTLGINGKSIAAALPIQSELNRTTAQNAIVSVGAIKALLYEQDTVVVPRVVGIYLPFAGGKALVNAIISEISRGGYKWEPLTAPLMAR